MDNPGHLLHHKILNSITSQSPFCHVRSHSHRFWGLGCGYVWGALVCPAPYKCCPSAPWRAVGPCLICLLTPPELYLPPDLTPGGLRCTQCPRHRSPVFLHQGNQKPTLSHHPPSLGPSRDSVKMQLPGLPWWRSG